MTDWQKGDLALCVQSFHPQKKGLGCVYTVEWVVVAGGEVGLVLSDGPVSPHMTGAWSATCFRKVTPPKADEFDREVIEQMTNKPATVGA